LARSTEKRARELGFYSMIWIGNKPKRGKTIIYETTRESGNNHQRDENLSGLFLNIERERKKGPTPGILEILPGGGVN